MILIFIYFFIFSTLTVHAMEYPGNLNDIPCVVDVLKESKVEVSKELYFLFEKIKETKITIHDQKLNVDLNLRVLAELNLVIKPFMETANCNILFCKNDEGFLAVFHNQNTDHELKKKFESKLTIFLDPEDIELFTKKYAHSKYRHFEFNDKSQYLQELAESFREAMNDKIFAMSPEIRQKIELKQKLKMMQLALKQKRK